MSEEVRLPEPEDTVLQLFASRRQEAAELAAKQGRWADAAWHWQVLLTLDAQDAKALAGLAQANAAAAAATAERMQQARQAQQRGERDKALKLYLEVLAIAPEHAAAAAALREMERVRTRRGNVQGYRPTLAAPSVPPVSLSGIAAARNGDRNDLEHAAMLAAQGDLDAAIAMLQPLALGSQGDPTARAQLAEMYFRQAQKLEAQDRAGAVAALERCLKLVPGHRYAAAKLKTLRSVEAAPAPGASARSAPVPR
jgi:tetratricopeptide (TPR) repeat protein